MSTTHQELRRKVLRRVFYATNTLALLEMRAPPEGLFDAALTNGLLAIVAEELPGQERQSSAGNRFRSARELLALIRRAGGVGHVDVNVLNDGLDVTQPGRHGRADDEWLVIDGRHLDALVDLDGHPALDFLEAARGLSFHECVTIAFDQRAEEELPLDPKDRLDVPEPDECPDCGRSTFIRVGWDDFGGTASPGECIACGYERSESEAYDIAVTREIRRHLAED